MGTGIAFVDNALGISDETDENGNKKSKKDPFSSFVGDVVKTATSAVQGVVQGVADPLVKGISDGADKIATDLSLNTTNQFLNSYVNFASGGTFGVDESGNARPLNDIGRFIDEGVGELTGRNRERGLAGRQAEIDAAKAAQQAEIAAENKRKEQIDVASSKAGSLARQSALSNYGVYGSGNSVSPLQNPSKDFMGL